MANLPIGLLPSGTPAGTNYLVQEVPGAQTQHILESALANFTIALIPIQSITGTNAAILASSPTVPTIAYATDTGKYYAWNLTTSSWSFAA